MRSLGADFGNVTFSGGLASFSIARFFGASSFQGATFSGGAAFFQGAKFHKGVSFTRAHFVYAASFGRTTFARFPYTTETWEKPWTEFNSDVDFTRAIFEDSANFAEACFYKTASFNSMQSKIGISLAAAKFDQFPDFLDATFHEAPRLDNVSLPQKFPLKVPTKKATGRMVKDADPRPQLLWLFRSWFRVAPDKNVHARVRKLRSMASQGKDSENELKLNAQEIRARRFWVDKPWPPREGAGRFWLGLIFDKLSDFGQSFARPLMAWLAAIVVFAFVYMSSLSGRAIEKMGPTWSALFNGLNYCHDTTKGSQFGAVGDAFALSLRNALIFDRSEASHRIYACLYGVEPNNVDPVIPLVAWQPSGRYCRVLYPCF